MEGYFTNKHNGDVRLLMTFNNNTAQSSSYQRHLGLMLDSKLNLNEYLSKKITNVIRALV